MKVKGLDHYKDGGTVKINTNEGSFYLDHRIGSNTRKLYDDYPGDDGAREIVKASLRQEIAEALREFDPDRFSGTKAGVIMVAEAIEKI